MRQRQTQARPPALLGVLAVIAAASLMVWVGPQLAGWVNSGHWISVGFWQAQGAVIRVIIGRSPVAGWPLALRRSLPASGEFWTIQMLVVVMLAACAGVVVRELDVRASRPVSDRRWWQLRGLRPRPFGRPRTIAALLVHHPDPDRIVIGTYGRPARLLAISANVQALVVAAPRSGKTSGAIIPALLEHYGPVVNTTVRTDVLHSTLCRRRRLGRVWVWNPFGGSTDSWDPLHGCKDWEHALLVARWLGHAVQLGANHSQEYFDQEAEGLTAPLLHAAALSDQHTILDVYRWILRRERDTPEALLRTANADDALERLANVYSYTERQRDGIIGTAAVQLKAYGHPGAARTAARNDGVTPQRLFANGEANSLYIVAGREHQQLLAPLVVTLLSSLLYDLSQTENRNGHGLWPPALFALDETANIAPLQDLPQILATSLPSARFLTVWHSIAQMHRHYGDAGADELLALSQAKVFLGSITDRRTVQELTRLLGQRASEQNQNPEILTAQALQRMTSGEGLLVHTDQPPTFYRQRRYCTDPALVAVRSMRSWRRSSAVLLGTQAAVAWGVIAATVGIRLAIVAAVASAAGCATRAWHAPAAAARATDCRRNSLHRGPWRQIIGVSRVQSVP
jgi:type IV secretion system protein VirD4